MKKIYRKGFTLIELMIVITVIAILAGIVLFGLGQAQRRARDVQRQQLVKSLQNYLQSYASDNTGAYPVQTTAPVAGATTSNVYTELFTDNAEPNCTATPDGCLGPYLGTGNNLPDPGCGTVTAAANLNATNTFNGVAASGNCTGVGYFYQTPTAAAPLTGKCAGAPYQVILYQESGGSSYFCGPKA